MSFLSVQELVELKNTRPAVSVYGYDAGSYYARDIDADVAGRILTAAKNATLRVAQQKINRPWEMISLTDKLDPKQPWLGFEFETGFNTLAEYQRVINFVWDNIDHVAIDREGYGQYCPEITFSPQNLSAYMDKSADIYRTIQWMNEKGVRMPDIGNHVGTHLNISTPAYRDMVAKGKSTETVVDILNHSILMMPETRMVALFGRKPYGLGNAQASWIEFKMFRSTDNLNKLDGYMQVSKNFASVMEQLCTMKLPAYTAGTTDYIPNFAALLAGKAKDVEIARSIEIDIRRNVGTRMWRSRYGATYGQYNKPQAKAA